MNIAKSSQAALSLSAGVLYWVGCDRVQPNNRANDSEVRNIKYSKVWILEQKT